MDQVKVGQYIAELRKTRQLTQEQLGEALGVTNKTVSRWENGNHMPDIDTFQALAKCFDVPLTDLLAGQKLTEQELLARTDALIVDAAQNETFSLQEKTAFWKKKWRREHRGGLLLQALILVALWLIAFFARGDWTIFLSAAVPLLLLIVYCFNRGRMMSYVESKLYD